MQSITIRQVLEYTFEVQVADEQEAVELGNLVLSRNVIPLDKYEVLGAEVSAHEKDNVIYFPVKKNVSAK